MPNYTHVWNTHQIVSRLHIEHCSTKFEQNAVLSWILEKMDKTKSKHTGTQNKKIVVKSMKLQNGYHIPATHTHCAQENLHNSRAHNWSLIRSHAYKTKMHHVFHTNEMKRRERTNFQFIRWISLLQSRAKRVRCRFVCAMCVRIVCIGGNNARRIYRHLYKLWYVGTMNWYMCCIVGGLPRPWH